MSLLDRHLRFVDALRSAGLPVSLSEGLDAAEAMKHLDLTERSTMRAGYAATVLKRESHRPAFDEIFDLFFPPRVGPQGTVDGATGDRSTISPESLKEFRDHLAEALMVGDEQLLDTMAREAVERFGLIRGRGAGEQRWSSYNVSQRVAPSELVAKLMAGLGADLDDDPVMRRSLESQVGVFERAVETDVRRRAAEVRGPEHVAEHTVRPNIESLDFSHARKADLEEMRRQIYPLARRLATRLSKEHHAKRGRSLDFRRTVRASLASGGVPLETHHKPRRPGRTDLVVLCDVSGSVSNFASFTLMLVYALREQFNRVRAFTFVDEIYEVTDRFEVGGDPVEVLASLAASAEYASLWGRTSYGRAFSRFQEQHADALNPRTNLLILGDARSNFSDLALDRLEEMTYNARHAWWLNPEHERHWNTGDSAARQYAEVVPMVECRNLTQLGEFIHDLA